LISHCEIGERILRPVIKDEEILDMVRHHHERYDGKGYPDGLSGKDMPLADRVSMISDICSQIESCLVKKEVLSKNASILAVADAYDAMMSPRSYRAALSAEATAREVRKGAGSQFDPEVAAAILRITDSLASLFQEEWASRASKEAERLAKERNKREAEEAKKASKAEKEAKKEAELLVEVKAKIEAGKTEQAGDPKIYDGNVLLVLPPPVVFEQARQFKEYLERVKDLRILFFGASADEGFIIAVSARNPEVLIHILNKMSMVEKAIRESKKQIVLTLKETAAY
jgi:hypothetical protein